MRSRCFKDNKFIILAYNGIWDCLDNDKNIFTIKTKVPFYHFFLFSYLKSNSEIILGIYINLNTYINFKHLFL